MRKYPFFLLFIMLLAAGSSCQQSNNTDNTQSTEVSKVETLRLSAADFKTKLDAAGEQINIIDVRTPNEFAGGNIAGAVNINFYDDDFDAQIAKLNKDLPTFVYCQAGGRSQKACNAFEKLGFKEIYELEVGYGGWPVGQ
jgi:rhodanese-related sulfurtransferase